MKKWCFSEDYVNDCKNHDRECVYDVAEWHIKEVDGNWTCDICGTSHEDKSDARDCAINHIIDWE